MKTPGISIGTLEKSVTRFADKLSKDLNVEYEIDTFRSGNYSDLPNSYVELTIEREKDDVYIRCKFQANGYCGFGNNEFGGLFVGFSVMKEKAMEYITKELTDVSSK